MQQTPITPEQLAAWSQSYNGSESRQIATLAMSKTDLNDVCYVSRAAFAMRQNTRNA